jgi:hypothetical protein
MVNMSRLLKAQVWLSDGCKAPKSKRYDVEFRFVKSRRAWVSTHELVMRTNRGLATTMFCGLRGTHWRDAIGNFCLPTNVTALDKVVFRKGEIIIAGEVAWLLNHFLSMRGVNV